MHTFSAFVIILLCYIQANEAQEAARFLGIFQRFNDSIYDSYYLCSTSCGGELNWIVNGEDVGEFAPDIGVGRKQYITSPTDSSITFFSVLTAVHTGAACKDSVLLATQTNQNWRPTVECGRSLHMLHVRYDNTSNQTFSLNIQSGTDVKLTFVPDENDISSGNTGTQIIICQTNDNILSWNHDSRLLTVLTSERETPGNIRSSQFMNSSSVRWDALVLGSEENKVTSVLIWTDPESQESFSITCRSRAGEATVEVNKPNQPNSFTNSRTDRYSTETLSVSTPTGAGSGLVSRFSSIVFLPGISWMYWH